MSRTESDVSSVIVSRISQLQNGIAVPDSKNLICKISPLVDENRILLHIFLSILAQNFYNTDFVCVFVLNNEIDPEKFSNLNKKMSERFESFDKIKIFHSFNPGKQCVKICKLFVVTADDSTLTDIVKLKPHIVMFSDYDTHCELIDNIMQNFLMPIISLNKSQSEIKTDSHNELVYVPKTCFEHIVENKLTLHINLIKVGSDSTEVLKKIASVINSIKTTNKKKPTKKILLRKKILIVAENVSPLYDCFTDDQSELNITPYCFNKKNCRLFKDANSGMMFINTKDLSDFNTPNIDCVFILDEEIRNTTDFYKLAHILTENTIDKHILFCEILERNLHTHLHRLTDVFYNNQLSNVQKYAKIESDIQNGFIKLDVEFNDMRKDKLERQLKITAQDKAFDKRHRTLYLITDLETYEAEEELLKSTDYNELVEEFELINRAKKPTKNTPHYSGAKWLCDDSIIVDTKIGFVHKKQKIVEFCTVIGAKLFSRREKRAEWKEKENKGRYILYLSPIIGSCSFSVLKQKLDISKFADLDNFTQFEIDFNDLDLDLDQN